MRSLQNFFSHCDGASELSVVDKQLFKRESSKYWKVAVPQIRSVPPEAENGSYQLSCGSFGRGKSTLLSDTGNLAFNSYVSYWTNSYGDGSWIGASPSFDYVEIPIN